jgi:hypothetical protein
MAGLLDFSGGAQSGGVGLLDFMANDPGSRLGLTMLAASSPKYGRGLMQALQSQDDMKRQAMQTQLLQSQIAENTSQNKQREQQMAIALQQQAARDKAMFGSSAPTIGANGAAGGSQAGGQQAGGVLALAQSLGIPAEAIQADYAFNGGKKIAELLEARSKPNWQNIGGNLVNTNAVGFKGGIQDQVQLGPDGRATMIRSNDGNPVMGAVPGSFDTYGAFKDIDNRTSARYSPGRPVIGPDGRQYGQSQLDEIGGGAPRVPPMAPPIAPPMGGRSGPTNQAERNMSEQVASVPYDAQKEIASVQRDLQSGRLSGQDRAQAEAYLRQLQSQAPTQSSAAGALDFSPEEKAAQEAARARVVDTAKADAARESESKGKTDQFKMLRRQMDKAQNLLNQGPTGSTAGALADQALGLFGMSTNSGELASALKATAGWMRQNVPKAPGAQSDAELRDYSQAIGDVGNEKLPVKTRLAALEAAKGISNLWEERALGKQPTNEKQNLLDSLPTPNASNKGQRIRDTTTGKILRSNGMQWKEE